MSNKRKIARFFLAELKEGGSPRGVRPAVGGGSQKSLRKNIRFETGTTLLVAFDVAGFSRAPTEILDREVIRLVDVIGSLNLGTRQLVTKEVTLKSGRYKITIGRVNPDPGDVMAEESVHGVVGKDVGMIATGDGALVFVKGTARPNVAKSIRASFAELIPAERKFFRELARLRAREISHGHGVELPGSR